VLVVPLLLIQNSSGASASPSAESPPAHSLSDGSAGGARHGRPTADSRSQAVGLATQNVVAVTPTTAPPTTTTVTAPATISAQEVRHMEVVPTTTTVTATPTTTTTRPPLATAVPATVTTGQVTYYDHPAGTCASPWLPFGTVVRITNPADGDSVSCVVNDREADTARAIDLATATFAEIAPLSQGVIDAQLSW
jgi:rare lipoprotein A